MTVVFDVHDDEDRRQYKKMAKRRTPFDDARAIISPTERDMKFRQLKHNPFVDDFIYDIKSFVRFIDVLGEVNMLFGVQF
jgi:hypothetical protein